MIPGKPTVGMRSCVGQAPKVAMDRSEVVSVTATYATPAGDFKNVLKMCRTGAPLRKARRRSSTTRRRG